VAQRRLDNSWCGYFFTAGTAAIVDVGGFALLRAVGIARALAAVASFCLAAMVNYLLSRVVMYFTEQHRCRDSLYFCWPRWAGCWSMLQ